MTTVCQSESLLWTPTSSWYWLSVIQSRDWSPNTWWTNEEETGTGGWRRRFFCRVWVSPQGYNLKVLNGSFVIGWDQWNITVRNRRPLRRPPDPVAQSLWPAANSPRWLGHPIWNSMAGSCWSWGFPWSWAQDRCGRLCLQWWERVLLLQRRRWWRGRMSVQRKRSGTSGVAWRTHEEIEGFLWST